MWSFSGSGAASDVKTQIETSPNNLLPGPDGQSWQHMKQGLIALVSGNAPAAQISVSASGDGSTPSCAATLQPVA